MELSIVIESYLNETYPELGILNEEHHVFLVQNRFTRKVYVRKVLSVYNKGVFLYLQEHPVANMPQIIELSEESGLLTIIEEYQTGDTFQELLDSQGTFSEEQTAEYCKNLCQILTELHHASPPIIHRDIKPANVMLSPDGVVKLIDVNAAKFGGGSSRSDTVLLGTAGFAAPEQYGAGASTIQTDLYAVGVLMNIMLCGELPTIQKAAGVLAPVIRKCLEVNPQDRYRSAEELRCAISDAMEEHFHPPGWKRYLPPGFRSGSMPTMAASAAGYLLLMHFCMTMEFTNLPNAVDLWINRLCFTVAGWGIVFITGNYLEVQNHIPFAQNRNPLVRAFAVLAADVLFFFAVIFFLAIVDVLFRSGVQ